MRLLNGLADDAGDILTAWALLLEWLATNPKTMQISSRHARKFLKLRLGVVTMEVREKAAQRLAETTFDVAMIRHLSKHQAIERAGRGMPGLDLNPQSTLFATVRLVLRAEFWSFTFPSELISKEINSSLNFLLHDYRTDDFYHLIISTEYLRDISDRLTAPMLKGKLRLSLSASQTDLLRSMHGLGIDFSQFLQGQSLNE